MITKFCVFCGQQPVEKTKEHVLPQWLIKLTGNPARTGTFGFDLSDGRVPGKIRRFSINQFHFPACKICNGQFSELESVAGVVVNKLLAKEPIGVQDVSSLLDWLDKVRLGLWLAYHQLDKNVVGIEPRFYISQRIGTADRMLTLTRSAEYQQDLSFIGPQFMAFRFMPSVFGLVVNDLFIVDVSIQNLLSRRLGFPFFAEPAISFDRGKQEIVCQVEGLGRVYRPVFNGPKLLHGTTFSQPMFPLAVAGPARALYETDYAKSHALDWSAGIGSVYCEKGDVFGWVEDAPSAWWQPDIEISRQRAAKSLILAVITNLLYLIDNPLVTYQYRSAEDRQQIDAELAVCVSELELARKGFQRWTPA